jgi:hypothetical protein
MGLSGIAKAPVSHGLNPTILRQTQAFAFSRSRRGYRATGLESRLWDP